MRMLLALFIFFFLNFCSAQQYQWLSAPVNEVDYSNLPSTIQEVGENEFLELVDGRLIHLKFDDDFNYSANLIDFVHEATSGFVLIDLDRDGDKDIITYVLDGTSSTYINSGTTFEYKQKSVLFDYGIGSMTVLDYNNDGYDDIFTQKAIYISEAPLVYTDSRKIIWWISNPLSKLSEVSLIDFDNDGDNDVVFRLERKSYIYETDSTYQLISNEIDPLRNKTQWIANINSSNGQVLISADLNRISRIIYNSGTDDFSLKTLMNNDYDITASPLVFDLDRDGFDEIIDFGKSNVIRIFKYDGSSDVIDFVDYNVNGQLRSAAAFTKNETSYLVCRYNNTYKIFKYDINNAELILVKEPSNYLNSRFQIDVDGDGFVDIVSNNEIKRYLGKRDFDVKKSLNLSNGGGEYLDLDNDGDLDIVQNEGWYENLGNLEFSDYKMRTPANPNSYNEPEILGTNKVYYGDLDGDNDIDIITYIDHQPVKLFENIQNDTFIEKIILVNNSFIDGQLRFVDVLDFEGDGDVDIIIAGEKGLIYLENLGNLNFGTELELYDNAETIIQVDVSDANNDGFVDVLLSTGDTTGGSAKGNIILYLGSEKGVENNGRSIKQGPGFQNAKFINFDSKNWKDIIYLNNNGLQYMIINDTVNIKDILIQSNLSYKGELIVKDLNGNGVEDVVYVCNDCETPSSQLNNKLIYFIHTESYYDRTCPIGDVYLKSQEDLIEFDKYYGSCSLIRGDLHIGSTNNTWSNIGDIGALSDIKIINGDLTITHVNKTVNYNGLGLLDSIYGTLSISNQYMNNLKGLENLDFIGGDFLLRNSFHSGFHLDNDLHEISNATILGNITIFNSLLSGVNLKKQELFYGDISITQCNRVANVDFLKNVKSIHGDINISNCDIKALPSLEKLDYIKSLTLSSNALVDFTLNEKIDSILGEVVIDASDTIYTNNLSYVGGSFSGIASKLNCNNLNRVEESFYSTTQNLNCNTLRYVGKEMTIDAKEIKKGFFSNLEYIGSYLNLTIENDNNEQFNIFEINGMIALRRSKLTNLNLFSNIKRVNGDLDLLLNDSLVTMEGLNDSLIVERLFIQRNAKLNYCNSKPVCNHLAGFGFYQFTDNGSHCSDVSQIVCNDDFVSGFVFFDQNKNGIKDLGEFTIANSKLFIEGIKDTLITPSTGYFAFSVEEGMALNIVLKPSNEWLLTTPKASYELVFEKGLPTNNQLHFGLYPSEEGYRANSTLIVNRLICDNYFNTEVSVHNTGTNTSDIEVHLSYPEKIELSNVYTSYYSHDKVNRVVTWKISNSLPWQNNEFRPLFRSPDYTSLGNDFIFNLKTYRDSLGVPVLLSDNIVVKELLCSYDPNDKSVSNANGERGEIIEKDVALNYTIQFENLGNFYAKDIVITDTLSNYLDISSFYFIKSSHDKFLTIELNNNVVQFIFSGINLPSKVMDNIRNKGFISFTIKTNSTIEYNDKVLNKAYIYFDSNPAIITNEVISNVTMINTVTSANRTENYKLYPNPAMNIVYIDVDHSIKLRRIRIYNTNGSLITESNKVDNIDISNYHTGLYFMELVDQLGTIVGRERFVKI